MANKFSKSTDFFAKESREARERQEAIVSEVSADAVAESAAIKRGRPAADDAGEREKLVLVSAYVPESMKNDLKVYTAATGQSISGVVRRYLEAELKESGFLHAADKLKH